MPPLPLPPHLQRPVREGWHSHANCADTDPEAFFPGTSANAAALRVCDRCPVRIHCLNDALNTGDEHGIRAGLGVRARRRLVRQIIADADADVA